jgi:hypothetical protein
VAFGTGFGTAVVRTVAFGTGSARTVDGGTAIGETVVGGTLAASPMEGSAGVVVWAAGKVAAAVEVPLSV